MEAVMFVYKQKFSMHYLSWTKFNKADCFTGSIPPVGAFVGSLVAGPMMQLLGRRLTLMISSPLWVLGWILIATSQNYEMMLGARVLTGFCVGLVTPSAAVYVSSTISVVSTHQRNVISNRGIVIKFSHHIRGLGIKLWRLFFPLVFKCL